MNSVLARATSASVWGLAAVACQPDFQDQPWLISTPRVLAVKSTPAEVRPGMQQSYQACIVAPPEATIPTSPHWSYCVASKPPTEDNAVSKGCLDARELIEAGRGETIQAATPNNGCTLYGPNAPPGGFRPRDPDVTGGYYQPLRLDLDGAVPSFHLQRILCHLADASSEIARSFAAAYVPNENPQLVAEDPVQSGDDVFAIDVHAGDGYVLEVQWTPESREGYAYFDRETASVTQRREALRLSFFATSGVLKYASFEVNGDDATRTARNVWTAPNHAVRGQIVAVLSDSRGGVDFRRYPFRVSN